MLQHRCDDQEIDDLRERQERGIKKSDNEQAGAADGDRERLDPRQYCFHLRDYNTRLNEFNESALAPSSSHAPDMTEPPVEIIAEPPRSPLALRIGALAAVWGIL